MITYEDFIDLFAELGATITDMQSGPFPKAVMVQWEESPRESCNRNGVDEAALVQLVEETPKNDRFIAALFMIGWEMGAKAARAQ